MAKFSFPFPRGDRQVSNADAVAVIGLGRFGTAMALELMATGTDVLGIDNNEEIVQALNGQLTHVVRADSTKDEVLRQLSVHEFDRVVVAISSDLPASILTASLLLQYGKPIVWAKAMSEEHGRILSQLGVHHVVYPEHDMGRREAHLVRSDLLDFIEIEEGFAIVKTTPPASYAGIKLRDTHVRTKYKVTVVAAKPPGGSWDYVTEDTALGADDVILVAGETANVEAFGRLL